MQLGIYQHYLKGSRYRVLMMAKDEPTLQDVVIYQALYGDEIVWVRNKDVFCENIEFEGQLVPRFKFIDSDQI